LEKDADKIFAGLEERLKFLAEIGADFVFHSESSPASSPSAPEPILPPGTAPREIAAVHAEILTCTKCPLASSRTRAVPGEGNVQTDLMFVGEGPGHDEDIQGRPFVGRAGQLLTKIIQAMTYDRSEVFITNIVKCRPPNNRVPRQEEIGACVPYLLEQIHNIRPKVIVTLGKVAADFFIRSSAGMTALRGRFQSWKGIRIMPTFHPSYLIRNEGNRGIKKMVWEDMQKVMTLLGRK
jgi:uracil-DNA glycosylase family 4